MIEGGYRMSDTISCFRSNFFTDQEYRFLLLNKDEVLASFHVDARFDEIQVDNVYWSAPSWIGDLAAFIAARRAPKKRENIAELLKLSGCDTILGYLQISHALSLVDTFWVKPQGSPLAWKDVSLYTHDFNEVIAKTAFEGGLHGMDLSTTSPEYGTDGTFAKCWIRENDEIKMLKKGSSGARNTGLEPYSEFYASQIIKAFTDEFVPYDLHSVGGRVCSVCPIFTSEEYGFLPYADIDRGNSALPQVIKNMERFGLEDKVKQMFVIDAVIMNEDRHKNNFGFLVDNGTQEIVGMAPLFDHNLSLLPYAEEDQFADIDAYLEQKGPRLADSWVRSAARCLTPQTRKKLINLLDFKFEKHPKFNLPAWRLDCLNKLVRRMVEDILHF